MPRHRATPLYAPLDLAGGSSREPVVKGMVRAYQSKDPWTFVASSEAVDRYGDVIVASGWQLKNFRKNPIALWQHSGAQPIGTWKDVDVVDGQLVATLEMVKPGVSIIADMLRGMVEQRVLRAVSVGFQPMAGHIERILDEKGNWQGGYRYLKSELLEISLVSVPANPEALSVAKALGMSREQIDTVFVSDQPRNGPTARAATAPEIRNKGMTTLAQRIAARQASIATIRDQLTELGNAEEIDEARSVQMEELTGQIDAEQKALVVLENAQRAIAASAAPAQDDDGGPRTRGGLSNSTALTPPPAAPGVEAPPLLRTRGQKDPAALWFRTAVVVARGHQERRSYSDIISKSYGGDQHLEVLVRAATEPAMTSVTGWAAELVGETIGGFIDVLRPGSIFFNLPMATFTFGNTKIRLPTRSSGTLAGVFVAEGAPIPVKQMVFGSVRLEPYKLGVISTFTKEMAQFSDPSIEPLLRDIMTGDTRETIDALFLDNVAAVATLRPAGLQQLAGSNTVASSGTTLANIITDLKAAIQSLATNKVGRRPIWIMNTQRMLSLSLMTNAAGNFMFRDELAQGTLMGIPVLASTTVPSAIVYLVDAAELAAAYDSVPQIDLSEQATLHMESVPATVPPTAGTVDPIAYGAGLAPGGTPGTGAVGDFAQPVRSLFQTASLALRLLWDMSWNSRRTGAVFTITGVAW